MATIVLAWELGSDLGHIYRYLEMARGLRARGHRPVLLLRNLTRADSLLRDSGIEYLQAPVWLAPLSGLPPAANLTEAMFQFGYLDPGLAGLVQAWRSLLSLLSPDLLVLDLAPTAALAARGMGFPVLITGNAYAVPPQQTPLPPFPVEGRPPTPERLADTESRVVRLCNRILDSLKAPSIRTVAELFAGDSIQIAGAPGLDLHGERDRSLYCGAITYLAGGTRGRWPASGDQRIFAYLKPRFECFVPILQALARSGASCLVAAPGVSGAQLKQLSAANVAIHDEPLNMSQMRDECDLAICHAGSGTVDAVVARGKPMLLFPAQREQGMLARLLVRQGCAELMPLTAGRPAIEKQLKAMLSQPAYGAAAQALATRDDMLDPDASLARFLAACEAALARRPVA